MITVLHLKMGGYGVYVWSCYALTFGWILWYCHKTRQKSIQVKQRVSEEWELS